MDDNQEHNIRLKVLGVLRDETYKHGGLGWGLEWSEIAQKLKLSIEQVGFACECLQEVEYVMTRADGSHGWHCITGKGVFYYETEIDKPQRERRERRKQWGNIAFGAVLTIVVKDFMPGVIKILLTFLQK